MILTSLLQLLTSSDKSVKLTTGNKSVACLAVYKERQEDEKRQVDEKYRKVFDTVHLVPHTASMFLASALN